MNATLQLRVLGTVGICALAFPLSSPANKTAIAQQHRPSTHAVTLLDQAAALVAELPAARRSPALNSLAEAWRPIVPVEARRILAESFITASSLAPELRGQQQADVVRRMAAINLPAARELAAEIRPPNADDYTLMTDWRSVASDGLLAESLARVGLNRTLEQARKMTGGLADTHALASLVRSALQQDPQAARDLVSEAAQQLSRRPITIQRFSTFPRALTVLAAIDRPMARRLFATLPAYLPEPPSTGEADTESGKQRTAFLREATAVLLRKAASFDPALAQEWTTQLGATHFADDNGDNASPAAEQQRTDATSQVSDSNPAASEAQAKLRLAQKLNRKNPLLAKDLLSAGRNDAATISDPALRARFYANTARADDLLHDPHMNDDLEAADGALAAAERAAKSEDARDDLILAQINVMQMILQKLDVPSAESRAQQFTNPAVRFRALLLVAQRWQSAESQNPPHPPLPSVR